MKIRPIKRRLYQVVTSDKYLSDLHIPYYKLKQLCSHVLEANNEQ